MILAVSGSSGMTDANLFAESIGEFMLTRGMVPAFIITGGCEGADQLATNWAREHNIAVKEYRPQWSKYPTKREAIAASNAELVSACTHMLAFPHPRGRWTQHAMELTRKARKNMMIVDLGEVEKRKVNGTVLRE